MKGHLAKSMVYKLIFAGNFLEDNPSLISYFNQDDHGFDGRLMNNGLPLLRQWPNEFTVYVQGAEPVDYFLCGAYYCAVSEKFRNLVSSEADASEVEFLPIKVVQKENNRIFPGYWVMNVIKTLDALDWDHTFWSSKEIPYNDPNAFLNIIKPALKAEIVNGKPIFQLMVREKIKSGVYISALLMRKLEQKRATLGVEFQPIKVVNT